MIIIELKVLSEALWESVKTDLKLFSPIQSFVKKLAEFDYSNLESDKLMELEIYAKQIEEFFSKYRPSGDGLYIPPHLTSSNDSNVNKINELVEKLKALSKEDLNKEIEKIKPKEREKSKGEGAIFIGHGRSKIWARVQMFLKEECLLNPVFFESESRTSEFIINILDDFLSKASFAVIVMTAEDETAEEKLRARQNVIHEIGLFQGRLGFDKVIVLKQDEVEEFTNIAGLQYIPFSKDNIEQTFYEMQRKLKKEGLLK